MSLTGQDDRGAWVRRYSRQLVLAEIGRDGQRAFLQSTVRLEDGSPAQQLARLYLEGAGLRVTSEGPADRELRTPRCPDKPLEEALRAVGQATTCLLDLLPAREPSGPFQLPEPLSGVAPSDVHVVIVGAGGLGCPAALGLGLGGVQRMTLLDDDLVELSNLPRQILHSEDDLGRPKVDSAVESLQRWFPDLQVEGKRVRLEAGNAEALLRGADLIVEGSDNFPTKFRVNAAAQLLGIPAVLAGVLRLEGQALAVAPGSATACYRCLFPTMPALGASPTCSSVGILGPVAGVLGLWQAELGLRLLQARHEGEPSPAGTLWTYDGQAGSWMALGVPPAKECPACGAEPDDPSLRGEAEARGAVCRS